jgi:hypothetical protein
MSPPIACRTRPSSTSRILLAAGTVRLLRKLRATISHNVENSNEVISDFLGINCMRLLPLALLQVPALLGPKSTRGIDGRDSGPESLTTSLGNYSVHARGSPCRTLSLGSFRTLASSTAPANKHPLRRPMARVALIMTCTIRYCRPGRPEDAGLIITKKAELVAYKARLEAAGYVVLDSPSVPRLEVLAPKSL